MITYREGISIKLAAQHLREAQSVISSPHLVSKMRYATFDTQELDTVNMFTCSVIQGCMC